MTTVIRNQIQLVQSPWKAPAQKWQSRKILVLRAFAMVCKIYMLSTINITRIYIALVNSVAYYWKIYVPRII